MAEVDKKLSEFSTAQSISGNDLEMLAVVDQESATGFSSRRVTAQSKAEAYLNAFYFPLLLNTTAKNIVGAINELAAGGGGSATIMTGTTAPTSAQGENGNLYVQYTAGTGGAEDTVDAMFIKLDDEWCEISTGGGGSGIGTKLTGTLEAGTTSVTFSDAAITTSSLIDVYTSSGIEPTAYSVSSGSLTLTFASQGSDVGVVVLIDARGSGSGGSQVSITPSLSSGDKIADFEIDGVSGSLYSKRELPDVSSGYFKKSFLMVSATNEWICNSPKAFVSASVSGGSISIQYPTSMDNMKQFIEDSVISGIQLNDASSLFTNPKTANGYKNYIAYTKAIFYASTSSSAYPIIIFGGSYENTSSQWKQFEIVVTGNFMGMSASYHEF